MKKVISIVTIVIVCLSMLSCKSAQGAHCDAYGQTQQVELKDIG